MDYKPPPLDENGLPVFRVKSWSTDDEDSLKENYGKSPNLISIRIHHGGLFTKCPGREYMFGEEGIIPALANVFPCAEHRFCLRHIHENLKHHFKWRNLQRPWRAHCDILLNNICESFNSRIVDGRDRPIITCLEYIREYMMKRIVIVQEVIEKCKGQLTPTATEIFEATKLEANKYNVIWNGKDKFQVNGPWQDQAVVVINKTDCSCRKWELTGIPCKHVVAAIWNIDWKGKRAEVPEDWVHMAYRLETWKEVYAEKIFPTAGVSTWPISGCPLKLLPPFHKTQVGRPNKKRKRSVGETVAKPMVQDGKLSRQGKTVTCGKCKLKGHNSKTCKGQRQTTSTQQKKTVKRKKSAQDQR